jgi:lipopolysaccharide assembly outer membrane protein LptD (OstA)
MIVWSKENSSEFTSDIVYTASDSIVMEGMNVALLYGDAQVNYEGMELKAAFIRVNLDSSTVYAAGVDDGQGNLIGTPVFTEGSETIESKALNYNMKSKKGFIYGTVTQQGEGYITSQKTKKIGDDVYCLQHGRYTTCDHHDHPHFYLALTKAKMKQGRYIVSGPAYMVVEDIPLPIALPFGYFPINTQYSSGILFPTLGEEQSRGFYAKGLGYYFAINDYIDLAATADIYSKGSWSLSLASSYKWRYRFSGSFNFSYVSNVYGTPNTPDYRKSNDFRFVWSHTQDKKMTPNTSFSASVNFSTSSYEQNNTDSYYNPNELSQNTKSSTVTLTHKFGDSPFSLSASMYVTQRTSDSTINLQLPSLNLTMSRQYPFKRKKRVGKEKWYEKISMSYTMNLTNSVTAKESEFLQTDYLRDWRYGVKHNLPISASFTLFKYLNMNLSLNNSLKWYFKKVEQKWEGDASGSVVRDTTYGFYNIYDGDLSFSMQTQLFGFYTLKSKSGKKMPVFRHKLVPSVGLSFSPDYGAPGWGYWGSYERPNLDGTTETIYYDQFAGGVYGGSPGRGASGNINMSIANNLEMKYWSKRDSTGQAKKVTIIDNLSLSTSYNMFADSLNWSDINANLRFKVLDKFSLNLDMVFDPYTYQLDGNGNPRKVNVSQASKNHVMGRIKSASTSFGYTFNNSTFRKKNKKVQETTPVETEQPKSELEQILEANDPLAEAGLRAEKEKEERKKADAAYAEFKVPWSLTFNYSVRYSYGKFNEDIMEYDRKLTHNLSLSGRINLTPTWAITMSTYYDITNNKWNYLNCTISKDLHCWQMSASFVPIGRYTTYNFLISVKSNLLKDLKYEKQSDAGSQVKWY